MCGILGRVWTDPKRAPVPSQLAAARDTLVHRGPDDSGFWMGEGVALGHRRLSIIDLEGGHQPMANEVGSVRLVFNGEIYNFPSLYEELQSRGHRFATRSDTEVIVHLYEEMGERCVERLRGMFAFGLWDEARRSLLLARDRVGKKPLYWACTSDGLSFASELKALMEDPAIALEIDPVAIGHYLAFQYVPAPMTILRGVKKLPPAHTLSWCADSGDVRPRRYWRLSFDEKRTEPEADLAAELRSLLAEAVRIRLVSDVPLGAFLSGGIDSSIVVALMAQASPAPVQTFSIGFEESEFSELPYARAVAERYATEHHEFIVRPDALDVVPELVWHCDEPFADSSAIPTYYLSKETRGHVTVALNGDGGDEAFGGYDRYAAALLAERYVRAPAAARRLAEALIRALPEPAGRRRFLARAKRFVAAAGFPLSRRYARWVSIFSPEMLGELCTPEFAAASDAAQAIAYVEGAVEGAQASDVLDRLLCADTETYLPGDLLVKVDRMTMAHGLEGRSPFLDHHIMEFAASLPSRLKLDGFQTKRLLKRALGDLLPPSVARRKKQGFGVPIGSWLRGPLRGWIGEVLQSPAARSRGYLRPEVVRFLIEEHLSGRVDHGHRLWILAMLELWHLMFVDRTLSPPAGEGLSRGSTSR